MPRISTGFLLYRKRNSNLEVFLVHPGGPYFLNRDAGIWSIPKGEIDGVEDYLACAARELKEEVGVEINQVDSFPLGNVTQKGGKVVYAWAKEYVNDIIPDTSKSTFTLQWPPNSGNWEKFPEVDKAEFFQVKEALQKINPAQAEFITRLKEYLEIVNKG